jgi:hypothetical protein
MWIYKGEEFTSEMIGDWVGFIYLITEKETGMKYVGKKLFTAVKKLKPLKDGKRRKSVRVETDWKKYWGSSEDFQALVEAKGDDAFIREILHLCKTKGEMNYVEAKEQFDREVLLRSDYMNGIIACKINHNHVNHMKK